MKDFIEFFVFFILASSVCCFEMSVAREKTSKGDMCKEDKYKYCGLRKKEDGLPLLPPTYNLKFIRGYMWEKHCRSMTKMTSCLIEYAAQCESFHEAAYTRMTCKMCSDKGLYRKIQNNMFCLYTDYYRQLFDGRVFCKRAHDEVLEYIESFLGKKEEYFPEMKDYDFRFILLDNIAVMHGLGCFLSRMTCEYKNVEEDVALEAAVVLFPYAKEWMEHYRKEIGMIMKTMKKKWQKHIIDGWDKYVKKCDAVKCNEFKKQSDSCWEPQWFFSKEQLDRKTIYV